MCKKVLIATLAVVVGLAVVKGTWVASHVRCWKAQFRQAIEDRIPPEQEIARLRMELDNLAREDDKHFDRVARQAVAVEKLEAKVARAKKDLGERESRIRAMKTSLAGDARKVNFKGNEVDRNDLQAELRLSAAAFQADEATLKSLEQQLSAKKQAYELNRKKLAELKLARQQMQTELQRLETALVEERQAQAQEANTLDDAEYIKIHKGIDSLRDKISVMKHKRTLKGEVRGPVRAAEERREQETRIDQFIEKRFGDKSDGQ
jgi:hypothetical protein